MTISHFSRRTLLLSIVVILGASILVVSFLSFSHSAARTSPGAPRHVAAQTTSGGHTVSSQKSSSGQGAAKKSSNEYGNVPSWDAPTSDLFVFIHEMHQGNWYAVNDIQSY